MNKELNKKIVDFYAKATMVNNLILNMKKYAQEDYLKNNWTMGTINIQNDIKQMIDLIDSCGFALDYRLPNTFHSYLIVFKYLIDTMLDELMSYEEGVNKIKLILKNIERASKPYLAFICSRVRDLGILEEIPSNLQSLYNRMTEEGIDELCKIDMSTIFDFAIESDEELYDDNLDELSRQVEEMFNGKVNLDELENIADVIAKYFIKREEETAVERDF